MPQCECKFCVYGRKVKEIIDRRNVDELVALVRDLMDAQCDLGEDLEYRKLILRGDWPGAGDILKRALCHAEDKGNGATA